MKISRRQLRIMIREEKARMAECGEDDMMHAGDMPAPSPVAVDVVEPADVSGVVAESDSPEGQLVLEMEMAGRNLELAVESINAAASLCPECADQVAAAGPLVEAMVTQAEALQETLDAVEVLIAESAQVDLDFTGDVGELPGEEAFAIGLQASEAGLV